MGSISRRVCWLSKRREGRAGRPRGVLLRAAKTWSCGLAVGCMGLTTSASAAPVAPTYVARDLTLPAHVLRLDAGHRFPRYDAQFKHVFVRDADDEQYLNPGVTYGVADDVEVGIVLPLQIAPDAAFHDPRAHALFQFHDDEVELGVLGVLDVGIWGGTTLTSGVPILWHAAPDVRLDTGAFLELAFDDTSRVGLVIPAWLPVQLSTAFFIGPEVIFEVGNLFAASGVGIDLGGGLGYTLQASDTALVDLYARARVRGVNDGLHRMELMLGMEWYIGL